MLELQRKSAKSIDDYRHSIKLLKYHLQKEKKNNETLRYRKMKKDREAAQPSTRKHHAKIYSSYDTVQALTIRLKEMGLVLGDIFRMADSSYSGEVTKEQFFRVIQLLKVEIQQRSLNYFFYAIDTNINGLISQDQFLEFIVAYGGSDSKETRQYKKKIFMKYRSLLKKKNTTPQEFIHVLKDPCSVYDFTLQCKKYELSNNQIMILLKGFDPSHAGEIRHEVYLKIMETVKVKDQQDLENERFQATIQDLCLQLRELKINPIQIFHQADVDGTDGVTPIELEQAFQKIIPSVTTYQIKKWVQVINANDDAEVTAEEFMNAIRSFYTLQQLSKYRNQYDKANPKKHNQKPQEVPVEQIMQQLANKIQDRGMTKKEAFDFIDLNRNGSITQQEMMEGLKELGIDLLFLGKVMMVFDRDQSQEIQLKEWLQMLGQDVSMSQVEGPQFSDLQFSQEENVGAKSKPKTQLKPSNRSNLKNEAKKEKNQTKGEKQQGKTPLKDAKKDTNKNMIVNPKKDVGKDTKKEAKKETKKEPKKETKKDTKEEKKKDTKKETNESTKKNLAKDPTKGLKEEAKKANNNDKKIQVVKQKSTPNIKGKQEKKTYSKKTNQNSKKPEKKVASKPKQFLEDKTPQEDAEDYMEEEKPLTEGLERKLGELYKKKPKNTLAKFRKQCSKNDQISMREFAAVLKQLNLQVEQSIIKQVFINNSVSGGYIQVSNYLEEISNTYAQNVEPEQQDKESGIQQQQQPPRKSAQQIQNQQKSEMGQFEPGEDENSNKSQAQQEPQKGQAEEKQQSKAQEDPLFLIGQQPKQKENKKDKKVKQMEKGNNFQGLLNNIVIEVTKRGQNVEQFKALEQLILKEGSSPQEGYHMKDYILDPDQMQKLEGYLKKAQKLAKNGQVFKDPEFKTDINSLTPKPSSSSIPKVNSLTWKHYKDIPSLNPPQLFSKGVGPNDIKQGTLGDCYFLASLSCLAQYTNLIERIFQYHNLQTGYFLIWLCIDGQFKIIQLDGYIVVNPDGKTPAFSKSVEAELWVILLQKAYAKAYGSFENINGGQAYEAVKDLSGGPGRSFSHQSTPIKELWEEFMQANKNQFVMSAGTSQGEAGGKMEGHTENVTKEGMVLGHAYSILDVREVGSEKIIQLRNPWGQVEWTGAWSDSDSRWTKELLQKFKYDPNAHDGIFWMPFEQFFRKYNTSAINYIRPLYYSYSLEQKNIKNLVIKLDCSSFRNCFIMVSQKDHRHKGLPVNTPYPICSIVALAYNAQQSRVTKKLRSHQYMYQREGCVELKGLEDNEQAVVLLNLQKSTDIRVSYYGDSKVEFEIQSESINYMVGLAYLEQDSPQAQTQPGTMKSWMSKIGDYVFLCFKNISSEAYTLQVETPSPNNIKTIQPSQPKTNKLKIDAKQIKHIIGKIIDPLKGYGFGQMGISLQ